MNKKGSMYLGIMMGLIFFMVGMVTVNLLKDDITTFRNADNYNCSGDISDGAKLTCLFVDTLIPYFFILVFSIAGGAIVGNFT